MAVLVQTGGNIKLAPPEYEQLINYTMLYDEGDECEEATGGWGTTGYSSPSSSYTLVSATKNPTNIYATGGASGKVGLIGTLNAIDVSEYSLMGAVNSQSANWVFDFRILSDKSFSSTLASLNSNDGITAKTLRYVDISALNVSAYFTFNCANTAYAYLYNAFLAKSDDINTLCTKAGISAPTSLDTLLSDTTSLTAIFNSEDAVKFMVKQCTGDFMVGVLNNANAVALLKASPYLNTVVGNPHWAKFMMMIPTAKELLNVTMLYDEGDECEDITGGWSQGTKVLGDNLGTVTFNNNSVSCYCTSSGLKDDARMSTDSPITLNGEYNKLWGVFRNITITGNNTAANGAMIHMSVSKTRSAAEYGDTKLLTSLPTLDDVLYCGNPSTIADGYYTNPLDLSALSGNYYVNIGMFRGADTSGTGQFGISNAFFTKSDNWQTWASLGGVTATDLATLLSDSTKMATLMANEEAVKYLMGCTGDLMVGVLNSTTAVTAITNNSIATTLLTEHPVWKKFIDFMPVSVDAGLNLV